MTSAAPKMQSATREVTITRVYDAPCDRVWQAWVDPEQMAQWWGPHGFTNPVCELDVRPGGKGRIHMRAPDGTVHPMSCTFIEVVEHKRLVLRAMAEDQAGRPVLEGETTVTFEKHGGKITITVRATAVGLTPAAPQMLAGMEAGWTQSLERLAALAEAG